MNNFKLSKCSFQIFIFNYKALIMHTYGASVYTSKINTLDKLTQNAILKKEAFFYGRQYNKEKILYRPRTI